MTNLFCHELNRVFVALKERDIAAMRTDTFYYVSGQRLYKVSYGDDCCHAREIDLSVWIADRKKPSIAARLAAQASAAALAKTL